MATEATAATIRYLNLNVPDLSFGASGDETSNYMSSIQKLILLRSSSIKLDSNPG